MRSHGRPHVLLLLALVSLIAWTTDSQSISAAPAAVPIEMLNDAELTAVYFLDPDVGWAVGDRGVILRTEDGGRNWQLQRTPVSCRLESVHFVNAQQGWAAGGWIHPFTHRTSGVVLRTRDGGKQWTAVDGLTLPQLKQIGFLDGQRGWAVGSPSSMYPTGLFRSEDGGRSWTTLPAGIRGNWLTGSFYDFDHGVMAGHDGQLAVVRSPKIQLSKTPSFGPRPIRAILLEDPQHGWLVGDGGLVLRSRDGGLTWQTPPGALPDGVIGLFDFRAAAVVGQEIWVAGAPGSCILHSPDRGATWNLFRTDQNLPIHDLAFVDSQRGWAVGALGTILVTRDGGRTWRRQKCGASRVALLGLFAEPESITFELFARESGEQGYIGFAEILGRRDLELPTRGGVNVDDQCTGAMSAVGASGADHAWNFPLRQSGLMLASQRIVDTWDRANDGRGLERLEELVVRKIRQWRPDVIVTEPAGPYGGNPVAHVTNQIVLAAVRNAADVTRYPEQVTLAGLEPWQVSKVFSPSPIDRQATTRLTTTRLAVRLGRSIADQADDGYALVNPEYQSVPITVGYRLLMNELPESVGHKDIFSGIFLQAGGEARRQLSRPASQNIAALTRAAQKRRNIEQLLKQTPGSSSSAAGWLGQVNDLTHGLRSDNAGRVLYQLGQSYCKAGRSEFAAQSFQQLVDRFPEHALAEVAQVWLIQYHASSEIAWQLKRATGFQSRQGVPVPIERAALGNRPEITPRNSVLLAPGGLPGVRGNREVISGQSLGGVRPAGYQRPRANPLRAQPDAAQTQFQFQGTRTTAGVELELQQRAEAAVELAKSVRQSRPELFAEPRVQFPISVAYRACGMTRESERFYHQLSATPGQPDWAACAKAELWLAHGRGVPPKPVWLCRTAPSRPRLDGQLDDAVWEQAEQLELSSAQHDDANWPATAMLACDRQFMYLAVSCRKTPGRAYLSSPGPRPRDPDLSDHDRIDLFLDLDRDYATYYRLSIDHRGWTGESCVNDVHWNPTWYVAATETEHNWTIEAAIPFDELAPESPNPRDVWAVGIQRIVPGVGIQAAAHPAAIVPRPESFSLLVFQ